ncbi:MAG TPA: S53 family peptidase [Planctomycetaceae bacterium]|nr:S53 family peptidase [Planctomycetaceae bacterium]
MLFSIGFGGALSNWRPKTSARSEDSEPSSESNRVDRTRTGNRGARRRLGATGVWQQVDCAGIIEPLEDRLLLSASFATPGFVIEGHGAIASGSSRGAMPHVTPANSGPVTPAQMQQAYGINQISLGGVAGNGAGQTIAIVDAYNDPNIIADASSFNNQFGLQQFNVSGGPTFKVLNENGGTSLPGNSAVNGWDVEESLDVEWAHSIAPQANVILFEASSNSFGDLLQAVSTAAAAPGVSVVSMSWSGGEFSSEASADSVFTTPSGRGGVTFLASTGDNGSPSGYPALSPNVVAVGGTTLSIDSSGNYLGESAWSGSGGGISAVESQPSYQSGNVNGASSTNRTVPDVAMDADPNTGVYVLDTYSGSWFQVGGTSLSCPMFAGLVAISDQGRALQGQSSLDGATQTLPMLYGLPQSDFHDITTGGNGTYNATPGYDLVTGRGTPIANLLVPALAGYGVAQPPGVSGPSSASVAQNGSLTFSSGGGNGITLSDSQIGGNSDSLTLSVSHGTLSLASLSGLSVTSGANGTSSITVSGTLSSLNAAVSGLVYTPGSGFSGTDSLSISLSDPGDSLSASHKVTLSVNAPPWFGGPAYVWVNENSTLTFSAAKGNALTVADSAAGTNALEMTLTAAYGKVTFSTMSGLTVISGANGSASVTVKGTLASLNATLNGLVFTPTSGYAGTAAALFFSITDLGDGLVGTAAIGVSVYAPPKFTAPATASVANNHTLVFSSAGGNAISLSDAAAAKGGNVQLTLTSTHGTLALPTTSGLVFTAGANHTATMTFYGSLANVLAALNGLTFTPTARYTGGASIKLTAKDLLDGQSGAATISLSVTRATAASIASPTSPPSGPVAGGAVASSVFAGGDYLTDETNYWKGIVAAIEALNRP